VFSVWNLADSVDYFLDQLIRSLRCVPRVLSAKFEFFRGFVVWSLEICRKFRAWSEMNDTNIDFVRCSAAEKFLGALFALIF
jgi:hypothetical protein